MGLMDPYGGSLGRDGIFRPPWQGMVKFHDCLKIARIAVPFPYSQAAKC